MVRVNTKIDELNPKEDLKLLKQMESLKIQYIDLRKAFDRERFGW
jgi:hypothetical protein